MMEENILMDTNKNAYATDQQKGVNDYFFGIGMGVLISLGFLGILVVMGIIKMPRSLTFPPGLVSVPTTTLAINPQQSVSPTPEDMTCQAQVKKYLQLSGNYYSVDNVNGGTMNGILKNLSYNVQTHSARLDISSADSTDTYSFVFNDNTVRLSNMVTHQFYTSLAQLSLQSHLELSYTCSPDGNLFSITSIAVVE